ncbi:MAG: mechanosensitive ion channel family protein [Myxococcota bacterium]
MNDSLAISPVGLLTFVLLGALLLALLRGLRHLQRWLRLTEASRARLDRVQPVAELSVVVLYVLTAAPLVFKEEPSLSPWALAALALAVLAVSWLAIRDCVDGLFLRAAGLCRPGDHISTGAIRGRVVSVGYRVVHVLTVDGQEAIVPYSRVTRDGLTRRPPGTACHRHVFEVDLPPTLPSGAATRRIQAAALGHHYASIARPPEIEPGPQSTLTVTIHVLAPAHAPDVESQVRAALQAD